MFVVIFLFRGWVKKKKHLKGDKVDKRVFDYGFSGHESNLLSSVAFMFNTCTVKAKEPRGVFFSLRGCHSQSI